MSLDSIVNQFVEETSVRKVKPADAIDWFRDQRGSHGLHVQDYPRFFDAVKARGVDIPVMKYEASGTLVVPPTLVNKLPSIQILVGKYRHGMKELLEALDKHLTNREMAEFLADNDHFLGKEAEKFFGDFPAWYDVEVHWRKKRRRARRAGVEFLEGYQSEVEGQPSTLTGDTGSVERVDDDGKILVSLDGGEAKNAVTLRPEDEGTIWRYV